MNIYRTSSSSGKFYGTAKKLIPTVTIDYISIRPIISNIGTVSCQPAKHLAKLFSPLSKLQYAVANNIKSISNVKSEKIPTGHSFLSFDGKSLFTNILLDHTIIKICDKSKSDIHRYTQEVNERSVILCRKTYISLLTTKYNNKAMAQRWGHLYDQ